MVKLHKNDKDIEFLTEDWVSVERATDPVAWQRWLEFRRDRLGTNIEPKAFTVPTEYPPITEAAAREYIATVKAIRGSIGWKKSDQKRLPA